MVPSTQILSGNLGPQHYNRIFIPKQSLDVVGLKELEILHTKIFADNLEFGNNDIIVWEAVRKKQKLENCIINIYDDDIYFGGLGVGGDTV